MGETQPPDSEVVPAYRYAPGGLRAKWSQTALKSVHEQWVSDRQDEYSTLMDASKSGHLFIDVVPDADRVGQYGYDADHRLGHAIDAEFLDDGVTEGDRVWELADEFGSDYIKAIKTAVREDCPALLSPREFLIYVAYQRESETRVADAFDVSVGTVRGKVGRVRDKFSQAHELTAFESEVEHFADPDSQQSFYLHPAVIPKVDRDELPVYSLELSGGYGYEYESYAPTSK